MKNDFDPGYVSTELERFAWDVVNELNDLNCVYFVGEIPDEFTKLYEATERIEAMLVAIRQTRGVR